MKRAQQHRVTAARNIKIACGNSNQHREKKKKSNQTAASARTHRALLRIFCIGGMAKSNHIASSRAAPSYLSGVSWQQHSTSAIAPHAPRFIAAHIIIAYARVARMLRILSCRVTRRALARKQKHQT